MRDSVEIVKNSKDNNEIVKIVVLWWPATAIHTTTTSLSSPFSPIKKGLFKSLEKIL